MRAFDTLVVAAIVISLNSGCHDKGSEPVLAPTVSTDKASYALDEHINYVVSNPSGQTIYVPTCCSDVQFYVDRFENGRWVVHIDRGPCDELMCPSRLVFVERQRLYIDSLRVNERGTYRLRLPYLVKDNGSETQELVSRPFFIQ